MNNKTLLEIIDNLKQLQTSLSSVVDDESKRLKRIQKLSDRINRHEHHPFKDDIKAILDNDITISQCLDNIKIHLTNIIKELETRVSNNQTLPQKLLFKATLWLTNIPVYGYAKLHEAVKPFEELQKEVQFQLSYPYHIQFPRPAEINSFCTTLKKYILERDTVSETEFTIIVALWLRMGRILTEYNQNIDEFDGLDDLYQTLVKYYQPDAKTH
jgi:hypothetical protein